MCAGVTGLAGDYLGGEGYWAGGLHLYTPLPFRPGRGGFGDLFRTHFFLNAGNLCNLNYGEQKRKHQCDDRVLDTHVAVQWGVGQFEKRTEAEVGPLPRGFCFLSGSGRVFLFHR